MYINIIFNIESDFYDHLLTTYDWKAVALQIAKQNYFEVIYT